MEGLIITHKHSGCDLVDLAWLRVLDTNLPLKEVVDDLIYARQNPDEDDFYWLARLNGAPVGYAKAEIHFSTMESNKIFVLPSFRNRGIGKKLKEAQIELARSNGLVRVYTEIKEDNAPSLKVNAAFGFRFVKIGSAYRGTLLLK